LWRMAGFLSGAALALAILALYIVPGAPSFRDLIGMMGGAPRIGPGFIGMANFGQWRLICIPGPSRQDGLSPAGTPETTAAPPAKAPNACRINREMPAPAPNEASSGAQVIIAANFSLIGPKRVPAAMLRLPVTARPGDAIGLRFDDGAEVQTKVRDCAPTECLAAGTLTASDWDHLSTARSLQVSFPAANRQWVLLDLPVDGLSTAIAALKRAEIPPP